MLATGLQCGLRTGDGRCPADPVPFQLALLGGLVGIPVALQLRWSLHTLDSSDGESIDQGDTQSSAMQDKQHSYIVSQRTLRKPGGC